ncbi:MAG TPA: sigma 54-interacting transcriptional regulator [Candidatus Acidoferrales bacterium]|nr:sigma 54-interacting transcriptional regulator [Candidatus Acidoferrales bacterium]
MANIPFLYRVNIHRRLTLCFIFVIVLMLVGNGILLWQLHLIRVQVERLSGVNEELIEVLRVHTGLLSVYERLGVLARSENSARLLKESATLRKGLLDDAQRTLVAFNHLPPEMKVDQTVLPTLESIERTLPSHLDAITAAAASGEWDAVRFRIERQVQPLESLSSELVKVVTREVEEQRAQATLNISRAERRIFLAVPITGFVTLLIAAGLGVVITRSITEPLGRVVEGSKALARGEFEHQISVIGADELAHVGLVFNDTARKLRDLYEDLRGREEKLRRSEAYLAEAQKLAKMGSWAYNPAAEKCLYWSDEMLRIFGLDLQTSNLPDREEFLRLVHPEDRDRFNERIDKAFREKADFVQDYRIVLTNGTVKHIHGIGHPVLDETGNIIEYVGTDVDVTERKRAEEALQRSEAYLAEAQKLTHTGSWVWNVRTDALFWSQEVFRIYDYDPKHMAHPTWDFFERIHPEDRPRFEQRKKRLASAQKEWADSKIDFRIVLPDGTIKHLQSIAHPVIDSGDEIVGTVMDVTERMRTEEKLRRSEADLLEAQRISQTGSWKLDVSSGKVIVSPQIFRIFGVKPDEGMSTPEFWLNRNHPEDAKRIQELFERSTIEKKNYDADYRIVLPDGSIKHLHAVGHPVLNESGDLVEFVGTAIDVTEQAQARIELEKAFEQIKRLKDRLHDENQALREHIDRAFMFEDIVGSSPALQTVLSSIVKVAPTDSTVLITGETGTGKELIARAIHKHSQRSGQAFISVNCASIPSSLIASELFGHEKGAFTGAVQRRQGRFELAHSGTIFLDEVGELSAETQIALLRVLQERQFERVGGNRILTTNVRVIAATNRDLPAAIDAGTFRSDLFYRLNVFPIEVPPLRKRKEDIPMLVEYFVKRYAEKAGKQIRRIDNNTLELCQSYPWPGNIRELQNIVERSVILTSDDTFWIEKAWLASPEPARQEFAGPLPDTLQNQEKVMIETALAECKGKVAGPGGAAAKLGIPRSTLDSKIKQLNIKKHKFISAQ